MDKMEIPLAKRDLNLTGFKNLSGLVIQIN
jgi:hypothetical protein